MNRYLSVIRATLLVLVVLFVITFISLYLKNGTVDYLMLTPVAGLLFFYFITRPKSE